MLDDISTVQALIDAEEKRVPTEHGYMRMWGWTPISKSFDIGDANGNLPMATISWQHDHYGALTVIPALFVDWARENGWWLIKNYECKYCWTNPMNDDLADVPMDELLEKWRNIPPLETGDPDDFEAVPGIDPETGSWDGTISVEPRAPARTPARAREGVKLLTLDHITDLRKQLDERLGHTFEKGVMGGGCTVCGWSYSKGPNPGCHPANTIRVDREVCRSLLDMAQELLRKTD